MLGPGAMGDYWFWRMVTHWRFISCLNKHSKQLCKGLLSHRLKLHPLSYTEVHLSVWISSASFGKTSGIYSSSVNKTALHSLGNTQKGSWLRRSLQVCSQCSCTISPRTRGGANTLKLWSIDGRFVSDILTLQWIKSDRHNYHEYQGSTKYCPYIF